MKALALAAALLLIPTAATAQEPACAPPLYTVEEAGAVTLAGTGGANTAPFALPEGSYVIDVEASGDSLFSAFPKMVDGGYDRALDAFDQDSFWYGIEGGTYFLTVVATDQPWTVTITPMEVAP